MSARKEFEDDLAATLNGLRDAGLMRQMRLPRGIDLVSNDYLGLAEHPYLNESMQAALDGIPAGSGGSRLLRGHHEIFERIEHRLASFSGSECALLFGSGYAANIGLLQAIVSPARSNRVGRTQSRQPYRRHPAHEGRDRHLRASGLRGARGRALAAANGTRCGDHRKRVQHGWRSDAAP